MGAKRPFQEEDFPELSFKLPKQLVFDITLASKTDGFPPYGSSPLADSPERNFHQIQVDEKLEDGDSDSARTADKELEASAPLSLVTSSSSEDGSEEDVGNEDISFFSNFTPHADFGVPRERFEDPYVSLFHCSRKKEVPVGQDHQADVPCWDSYTSGKDISDSSYSVENDRDKVLMGTCTIPLPDINCSPLDEYVVGRGRRDCRCLDVGSSRCVQQHVKEAREDLRETLGEEKFSDLGFLDMGETVASKWSADDERVFHDVIFYNPVSHGKNFWKQLNLAFPTRTRMELVSYYFNVFMLRRRAIQNRSYMLEIDSDNDDDRRGRHEHFYRNTFYFSNPDTNDEANYSEDPSFHGSFYEANYSEGPNSHGSFYLDNGLDDDPKFEPLCDQLSNATWLEDDCWSEHKQTYSDDCQ